MDILLFNPYYSQLPEYYSFFAPAPPVGLMYLAAYLRKKGISCGIRELGVFDIKDAAKIGSRIRFGLNDEAIHEILKQERPRIVGITNMYSVYYRDVIEIARTIKNFDPGIRVVLGGNHATSYWKYILKNHSVDYVCLGEGEETFYELCSKLLNNQSPDSVAGIGLRSAQGEISRTEARPLIHDLGQLPVPAYDMIDFPRYFGRVHPFSMRYPACGIVTSRGCPGECVYCTVKAVWGRTWRGRSPKDVADEIEYLMKNYGIREFAFLDDSASIDKKRWMGICNEIISRKLDIKWTTPNGIAHWTLTPEILSKMYEAGCYRVTFGIESGNPGTRKFLGKPYSLTQAQGLIRHSNRIGMWTICTNIIGFPYEDMNSIRDTIAFAKSSGTDFACFYLLIPQPTSEVYDYFKKEGLLNFDAFFESNEFDENEFERINYALNETGCDTLYFKKEELSRLQKEAYRSFILYRVTGYIFHPWRLLWKVRSREDFLYVMSLALKGFEIFLRTLNPLNKKSSDYLYPRSKEKVE